MCGIAGIVTENAGQHEELINIMMRSLAHRGPDSTNKCSFFNCVLGHTRLSIVDLNSGSQPMIKKERQLAITFNGEIYGYNDIRKHLPEYLFQTSSDTEVILALYEKYGNSMMKYLPGMFSFGIWDEKEKELFCARDRFGEKPFYFSIGKNSEFIFASEIKALLASAIVDPVIRKSSLAHYLRRGYVHPAHTIYENIFTLPPAHSLRFKNGKVTIERYWQIPEPNLLITFSDAVDEFKELLITSVKHQLAADVEVGAFLSGGLDSTTIVAISSQQNPKLKTYSYGYQGRNELPYARAVAKRFATNHKEKFENNQDIADLLIKMQWVYDEPFYDSAMIPTYQLSEMASQDVKVILTGDGADELLGGYPWWYYRCLGMEKARDRQESLIKALHSKPFSVSDPKYISLIKNQKQNNFSKGIQWMQYWDGFQDQNSFSTIMELHFSQSSILSDDELSKLGLDLCSDDAVKISRSWTSSNTTDDALKLDIEDYLAGDLLVKTDRASMSHGLELRSPFLDFNLASFCLSLPLNMKMSMQEDKMILRESFSNYWPEGIKKRSKQGFGAPLDRWTQQDSFQALKREYLDNPRKKIYQLIPYSSTQHLLLENSKKVWLLLILALWAETHIFD